MKEQLKQMMEVRSNLNNLKSCANFVCKEPEYRFVKWLKLYSNVIASHMNTKKISVVYLVCNDNHFSVLVKD